MVRGRARPQLGLQPRLQDGATLISAVTFTDAIPAKSTVATAAAPCGRQFHSVQCSAVRNPSGPPLTLIWPVTFRLLPSKLNTESALSTMLCTSRVLPSRLQTTPWPHLPVLASATFVRFVPFTPKIATSVLSL